MNNEIKNKKVEVPTGIDLNDKDHMTILLSNLKDLSKNYTVSLTEASCEFLYSEIKKMFDKIIALQRSTYELMFQKGWYIMEKEKATTISKKYQTLLDELTSLNEC